jgi:hypothetical protein
VAVEADEAAGPAPDSDADPDPDPELAGVR